MTYDYNQTQLIDAFKQVGLKPGDVVLTHSNIGFFGVPEEGNTAEIISDMIISAFFEVIGQTGTLVVPTFSYSFPRNQVFDPQLTASSCGIFTEMMRKHPKACRSHDPIFSVVAIGENAVELTQNVSDECFGKDSFWDRFLAAKGIICNLNINAGSTFMHYAEKYFEVPYRYNKLFTGTYQFDGQKVPGAVVYFVKDMTNDDTVTSTEIFDVFARSRGRVKTCGVGRGSVVAISAEDTLELIGEGLKISPWYFIEVGKTKREPQLLKKSNTEQFSISLPQNAKIDKMIEQLWQLPRDLVSDGYDAALQALATLLPMNIHEYKTGTNCWSWLVPEKWTCHEAYLETMDGRRIFSYQDHPLHVASYSQPFEGVVSREKLFEHLISDPHRPDAIPFTYLFYRRDWGLACSDQVKASLTDEQYRVVIRSEFSFGTLKVGEVVIPGQSEECFILCAHLDHPEQANDGLSGVAVAIDVMRELMKKQDLYYTYRLVIVPETVGSAAYLSHHEHLIAHMKGGLFMEALGLPYPHALQFSLQGDSEVDRLCEAALLEHDPQGWTGKFEYVVGNDETQFNAPGVEVPMASLSRVEQSWVDGLLYPEYHTHHDSMEHVSQEKLIESRDLILTMIDYLEKNVTPTSRYKGSIFLTRFGVNYNFSKDEGGALALQDVMFLLDGKHSVLDIAEKCELSFQRVSNIIEDFSRRGIVDLNRL